MYEAVLSLKRGRTRRFVRWSGTISKRDGHEAKIIMASCLQSRNTRRSHISKREPINMRSLEGITVVAVEQAVAAPYASSRLADAGARGIKVERPESDFARNYDRLVHGQSAYFVWLNRG